jgi:hypothetical protein
MKGFHYLRPGAEPVICQAMEMRTKPWQKRTWVRNALTLSVSDDNGINGRVVAMP